ncbi:MAG: hypothetical protein JWP95_1814 [Actinotalea sp.]|jgi:hypothetical protein|nr:hypothetical protein [Actinotalea sp.]
MGLGTGITLMVVGAILAFAVRDSWDVIDLTVIGYICLAAGALAIILTMVMQNQRRNTTHREVVERYDDRTPPPPVV